MTIIGTSHKSIPDDPRIKVITTLDKSDPAQIEIFNATFMRSAIFILPTNAEAYGLVYAEAAAFGCIAIGPKTGGVPSIILDNETGLLVPEGSGSDAYTDLIIDIWPQKEKLKMMSTAARERFERDLNWDRWVNDFGDIVENILSVR